MENHMTFPPFCGTLLRNTQKMTLAEGPPAARQEERTAFMKEFKGSSSYVVSSDLLRIVNVSIALQKPLLIKGEPGTGKTMLAQAISEALGKKLIIWNIKSTTSHHQGPGRPVCL